MTFSICSKIKTFANFSWKYLHTMLHQQRIIIDTFCVTIFSHIKYTFQYTVKCGQVVYNCQLKLCFTFLFWRHILCHLTFLSLGHCFKFLQFYIPFFLFSETFHRPLLLSTTTLAHSLVFTLPLLCSKTIHLTINFYYETLCPFFVVCLLK